MFDLSFGEIIVIFLVALVVLGPDKLPDAAKRLGKVVGSLRKTSNSVRREFLNAMYQPAEELKNIEREAKNLISIREDEKHPNCPDNKAKSSSEATTSTPSDATNQSTPSAKDSTHNEKSV